LGGFWPTGFFPALQAFEKIIPWDKNAPQEAIIGIGEPPFEKSVKIPQKAIVQL
jgi:hypothetical protein